MTAQIRHTFMTDEIESSLGTTLLTIVISSCAAKLNSITRKA